MFWDFEFDIPLGVDLDYMQFLRSRSWSKYLLQNEILVFSNWKQLSIIGVGLVYRRLYGASIANNVWVLIVV